MLRIEVPPREYSCLLELSGADDYAQAQFLNVDFTAQIQYFMMRVANFETLYLRHFWPKIQSFCAH